MIPFRRLITLTGRTTMVCAALVLALGTGLVGLLTWRSSLDEQLTKLEGEARALNGGLESGRSRLDALVQGKDLYDKVAGLGLIGPSRREAWVHSLFTAYGALGFQGLPSFKLEKAKQLDATPKGAPGGQSAAMPPTPGMPAGAPSDSAASTPSVSIWVHDLEFKLVNSHEVDVLSILAALRRDHPGVQRPMGCLLSDPLATGLSAVCRVRFFNIDVPVQGTPSKVPS